MNKHEQTSKVDHVGQLCLLRVNVFIVIVVYLKYVKQMDRWLQSKQALLHI